MTCLATFNQPQFLMAVVVYICCSSILPSLFMTCLPQFFMAVAVYDISEQFCMAVVVYDMSTVVIYGRRCLCHVCCSSILPSLFMTCQPFMPLSRDSLWLSFFMTRLLFLWSQSFMTCLPSYGRCYLRHICRCSFCPQLFIAYLPQFLFEMYRSSLSCTYHQAFFRSISVPVIQGIRVYLPLFFRTYVSQVLREHLSQFFKTCLPQLCTEHLPQFFRAYVLQFCCSLGHICPYFLG